MDSYAHLCDRDTKIAVVGLGYVGMPLAVAFSHHFDVVGFDVNDAKVASYRQGVDATCEVGDEALLACDVDFTTDPARLREAAFVVVAVPTPINGDKTPDLTPIIEASRTVGQNLARGSIVVYESTVYPGVTEEVCVPILERESGLVCGADFKVGYSPERINPGDRVHTLATIRKVVSGMDAETLDQVSKVYGTIIEAGVWPASSIRTAEAVKVVENSQRDINIAFMNEMAMVFDRMGIDTNEVVDGMNTKWNALGFRPGLVGGHCIGVDPYYFIYEAEKLGYTSQIVSSGRHVNSTMGEYVAEAALRQMIRTGVNPVNARVAILGLTFKENCPDTRNTRVIDIVSKLREYGIEPLVCDPWADPVHAKAEYGIDLVSLRDLADVDCVIHAVAHREFFDLGLPGIRALFGEDPSKPRVLLDVKGVWGIGELEASGIAWWRL